MKLDSNSQQFLNIFLERGITPGFQSITRPFDNNITQGTCK